MPTKFPLVPESSIRMERQPYNEKQENPYLLIYITRFVLYCLRLKRRFVSYMSTAYNLLVNRQPPALLLNYFCSNQSKVEKLQQRKPTKISVSRPTSTKRVKVQQSLQQSTTVTFKTRTGNSLNNSGRFVIVQCL